MKILDVYNKHEQNRKTSVMSDVEDDVNSHDQLLRKGRDIFRKLDLYNNSDELLWTFHELTLKESLALNTFLVWKHK